MAFDFKRLKIDPAGAKRREEKRERESDDRHKRLTGMVNELQKVERGLTDWELGFIADMERRLEQGAYVSPKQEEKLQQVWTKIHG